MKPTPDSQHRPTTPAGPRDRHKYPPTVLRLPDELAERLRQAADDHQVSVNWLAVKGIAEFLDHLLPADEVKWTRE